MPRKVKPAHYRGGYHIAAAKVRAAANADPNTTCQRCGQLGRGPRDPWDAGHLRDGDPTSPLGPEHRSCNRSAGATLGNAKRRARRQAQPAPTDTSWRW